MLDIKFIREHADKVKWAAKAKHIDIDIDELLRVDEVRRTYVQRADDLRAVQNRASQEIAQITDANMRAQKIEDMQHVKKDLRDIEEHLAESQQKFDALMRMVPNIPYEDVPQGLDESANKVLREVGKMPKFSFDARDYVQLAELHDWIDVERAAKVSGTRFGYIKGDLALLEFALVQYVMQKLSRAGFIPVVPPVLVKPEHMDAMGFLWGDMKDDIYFLEQDQLYLVGTSEQSIGPMHAGETFDEKDLPRRYGGFSTCFRREAGSYGKDTKGILRVHQFDKVEMVSFCHPDKSREEHKYLLQIEEDMMKELKLPYRVIHIATGDMGLSKAEQFDIEAWIPSEGKYRETHSASNITDFQARRLNVKYRGGLTPREGSDPPGRSTTNYVHMLNATAFAVGRTLIAILENFQQKDGSVKVPDVLAPYFGGKVMPRK